MKIGINLLHFSRERFGGAEQYLKNLIRELADQDGLTLFLFLKRDRNIFPDHPRIEKVVLRDYRNSSLIYEAIQQRRLDLWFCPLHSSYVPDIPVPTVVTIHDVLHTFYPEFVPGGLEENNRYYQKFQASFNAVITVSQFSRTAIIERLHIPQEKVHAIYLDAPEPFHASLDEKMRAEIKAKYQLPDHYALYPASFSQHKNHLTLMKALLILRDRYHERIPLVLSGYWEESNPAYQAVIHFIKDHALEEQVKIVGYIPEKEMPYLYLNCTFLVFPSLHEGFGIPLVEAMNTSTPIVCSYAGSIPEVAEDAALLFNPQNPEEIALKMLKGLDPKTRIELIKKGTERARAFSWEKCAQETLHVFRSVLPGS
ncbi:glycosyltransferase family 1 protein [Paenibacillus motobuensis]|uniref:Glycosyltransferase family 1 protein n=1 Tax=Paenibacillus motobuensis TaxID=295324 RepID=A0ABN0XV47_9BACL